MFAELISAYTLKSLSKALVNGSSGAFPHLPLNGNITQLTTSVCCGNMPPHEFTWATLLVKMLCKELPWESALMWSHDLNDQNKSSCSCSTDEARPCTVKINTITVCISPLLSLDYSYAVVEEVLQKKVPMRQCKNTLLEVLRLNSTYKNIISKMYSSIKFKGTRSAVKCHYIIHDIRALSHSHGVKYQHRKALDVAHRRWRVCTRHWGAWQSAIGIRRPGMRSC